MPFQDRQDAGRQLARLAERYGGRDVIVIALPRGGVPVGFEVARALGAPLDILAVRKLGAPTQPEFGVGAIGPGGVRVLDADVIEALGVTQAEMRQVEVDERQEMERRLLLYRDVPEPPDVQGKTVLLVDDGLATGVTARAAVMSLRRLGATRVVLAVPVAAPESVEAIRPLVDDVLVLEQPRNFRAVGMWYREFAQTSDDEVLSLLREAKAWSGIPEPCPAIIPLGEADLHGELVIPRNAEGVVVFAHGSGSSRFSPRNQRVAKTLQEAGLGTLLLDLLTPQEERVDAVTRHLRFDIPFLARRLGTALDWLDTVPEARPLRYGLFGSSTGGGAALVAAAARPDLVSAVVSRGGRPDLAGESLPEVRAATLLIVGGHDEVVVDLNRDAMAKMHADVRLHIVQGATHLFEEPGALEEVSDVAAMWFRAHLGRREQPERRIVR